jgi:chromosome partitioning protein
MAAQLFYVKGKRATVCSPECRTQLMREAQGVRLGQIDVDVASNMSAPEIALAADAAPLAAAAPRSAPAALHGLTPPAVVVPVMPATPRAAAEAKVAPFADKPRIIAVFNHKGGTGKTTSAVSVAAGLAMKGKRVLLVDTDAQGNVSVSRRFSERSLTCS